MEGNQVKLHEIKEMYESGEIPLKLHGATYRDTITVPPAGAVVARIVADNPGKDRVIPVYIKRRKLSLPVADLGGSARGAPLGPENFSISCSFSENLAILYVGANPPPPTIGAPSYWESWIHPCLLFSQYNCKKWAYNS